LEQGEGDALAGVVVDVSLHVAEQNQQLGLLHRKERRLLHQHRHHLGRGGREQLHVLALLHAGPRVPVQEHKEGASQALHV
ncbi:unnamed protein product, partial [Ixodes pacificus]